MASLKQRRCEATHQARDAKKPDRSLCRSYWFRGLFTEEVAELECNNRYKSTATQAELLLLSGAFEPFAAKDGYSLSPNPNEARSS